MLKTNRFKEKSGRQNRKLAELTSKVTVGRSTAPTTTKLLMDGLDRNGSYALVTIELLMDGLDRNGDHRV